MTNHPTEEQMVLHYYGDDQDHVLVAQHLATCTECSASFARLTDLLGAVKSAEMPEPLHGFEERTWKKVHARIIESRRPRLFAFPVRQWVYAMGITAAIALAFFAGRFTPRDEPPVVAQSSPEVARERILLITVADHLERSQLMLLELINADTAGGVDFDRGRAAGLVADNRLFRQAASRDGDAATAAVLADLERVLMEIENSPDSVGTDELEILRAAIEDKGLLLRVRVVGSQARERVTRPQRDTIASVI